MKFKLWSNILFLVPLYISTTNGIFWYMAILTIVLFFSIVFHYFDEKKFKNIDAVTSLSLIISNIILLFQGKLIFPYGWIALLSALIAILFHLRQLKHGYNFNHGMWHVFSALTCYFSVLTFIW